MKAKVVLDGLFTRVKEKPASNNMDYEFFTRYLTEFDGVEVIARCFPENDSSASYVEGDNVSFTEFPAFQGPKGFFLNFAKITKLIYKNCLDDSSAVILRLPATIPSMVGVIRLILNKPFAVELVGDPLDAYSPESLRHPLSKFFQSIFYRVTRMLCKRAVACSYVTAEALQQIYPNKNMYSYTSLSLPKDHFKEQARQSSLDENSPVILMVAMMQNYYKGHDLAVEAIDILVKEFNFSGKLVLVGDGPLKSEIESDVLNRGLQDHIQFYGKSSAGVEVFNLMDKAELLLLPSRQEGLPRVVIEAMARALPVVCTNVGGTKELVKGEQILDVPLSARDLANRINRLLSDEPMRLAFSLENLRNSARYEAELVQEQRNSFYRFICSNI